MTYLEAARSEVVASGSTVFPGDVAFKLHDTHGFPIELTSEIAAESDLAVDRAAFDAFMQEQKSKARSSAKTLRRADDSQYKDLLEQHGQTDFVGRSIERFSVETTVVALLAGEDGLSELFLESSPFYAESGGQVGDHGTVVTETGRFDVIDCQNVAGGLFSHRGRVTGEVLPGQLAVATIDPVRREATARNHTATHLLHAALRSTLGDHVRQQGSYVGPDRLRFDFSHGAGLAAEESAELLQLVNGDVLANAQVETIQTSKAEAEKMGAVMFFGDKYGDQVRVVRAGSHSLEFCGGTHVGRLGDIGQIQIVSEASIGSGTRRLEAVSGSSSLQRSLELENVLSSVATLLKSSIEDVVPSLERALSRQRELDKDLASLRQAQLSQVAETMAQRSNGEKVVAQVDGYDGEQLRILAQEVQKLGTALVIVVGVLGEKVSLAVASDGVIDATTIVRQLATHVSGGGGGSSTLAMAGGKDPKGIPSLLVAAEAL
jgi:alanyl-tRNA synthetase